MASSKTRFLVFAALLTAISVVFKVFLGVTISSFGAFAKDLNLSSAFVIYSGILLGPLGGGIVGALTDFLAFLIRPMGGYMPVFTITNALIGIIPALFYRKNKEVKFLKLLFVTLLVQTVCSFLLNTGAIMYFYGLPLEAAWLRGISAYVQWPIYTVIVYYLYRYTSKLYIIPEPKRPAPVKIATPENTSVAETSNDNA